MTPVYGTTGHTTYTQKVYVMEFGMLIHDHSGSQHFSGTTVCGVYSYDMSVLIPKMIELMFMEFPGQSGQSKVYSVPL